MANTPNRGYVYPTTTSPATVPADLQAPLEQIDADVQTLVDASATREYVDEQVGNVEPLPVGDIPIFATMYQALAWEAANPGRKALTIEPQTPDVEPPTAGTLTVSATNISATLTVTGAADDRLVAGYSFRMDSALWTDWQAGPQYVAQGLTPSTTYEFQHRVRDAAGNTATGTPVTVATAAIAPMTPSEVGDLWAHWDASEASTLSGDGTGVASWMDVSGAERSLTQSVAGQRPTTAAMGDYMGVKFDRVAQQYMRHQKSSSTRDGTFGVTICWVGRFDDSSLTASQVVASIAGAVAVGRNTGTAEIRNYVAPYMGAGDALKPNAGEVVMLAVSIKSLGPSFVQVSNQAGTSNYSSVSDQGSGIVDIGRNASSGGAWSSSTVGEFWIHDRALAHSELEALNLYARAKWGAL